MVRVEKYLTHLSQHRASLPDVFTDPTSVTSVTTISTVNCFAYFGEAKSEIGGLTNREFSVDVGWFVILPVTMHTVDIGDHFDEIRDNNQILVKDRGRVEEIVVYRHPRKGVQFVQVRLNDN